MPKKILVTGGAGFIGHHFIDYLLRRTDWSVVCMDRLDPAGDLNRLSQVGSGAADRRRLAVCYHDLRAEVNPEVARTVVTGNGAFDPSPFDYVVHMAAGSHVVRSVADPVGFVMDNVVGTAHILDFCRKVPGALRHGGKIAYFSCYDIETRALTKDGLKSYDELKVGDVVFGVDDHGATIEQPIERVIIQDYLGDMVSLKSHRVDFCVTPNHRMYGVQNGEIIIEEARQVAKRRHGRTKSSKKKNLYLIRPKAWSGSSPAKICVNGIGEVDSRSLMYLCGLFIGDGFVSDQVKLVPSKSGLSAVERLVYARDATTGRMLSTGVIGNLTTVAMHSHRIFFDIPEKDPCRPKLLQALSELDISYSFHGGKSGTHVYTGASKPWSDFFRQFGKGAKNKRIPRWILELDSSLLKCLFEGLIDSDGHWRATTPYSTSSFGLVQDLCELAFKLGKNPKFIKVHNESHALGRKISGDGYFVYFSNKFSPILSEKYANSIQYAGKIWCVQVKHGNLIVERNGKLAICGNTDEVFGPAGPDVSFAEWDRFNPNNPYCLPAGTPILMADGSWESIEKVGSGSLVIGYDFGSRVLKIGTVSSSMMKRGSRLLHLNTAVGTISCSPDHRVFRLPVHRYPSGKISKECVLEDLAAEEIRASDVQVGNFISVLRTVPEPSNPVHFDSEFARFLGYFAGDGYLHYNRRLKAWDIRLADQSKELLEKYEKILRNVIERHYGRKLKCWYSRHSSKDCWYLCFTCLPLVRQIQNLGLDKKASEKIVPVEMFGWDNESVAAFLSGLLDADGNVSCSKSRFRLKTGEKEYRKICISYSSASHRFLVSIRLLLRRIGVLCNISRCDKPRRRPTANHPTYITWKLSISDYKSLLMFRASIHPFTKPIPVTHSSTPIRLLQNETLVWARVTSVDEKAVNEIMYDLTVPGINNFVADGFVVHNSASKAGGEALCSAYSNTYGLPVMVTHTTNVFGERQHPEKFIPMLVRKILCREVVQIHADRTETKASTRFYTYVDNVSSAVLFLLDHGECLDGSDSVGKYNISGEREVSNLDLAKMVAHKLGRELRYEMISFCPSRPKHDMRYAIRNNLLLSLGWKPEVPFEEGLERTISYFRG